MTKWLRLLGAVVALLSLSCGGPAESSNERFSSPAPPDHEASRPPADPAGAPQVSGIWQVQVADLSIWAPSEAVEKEFGLVYWKIRRDHRGLSVEEFSPDEDGPTFRLEEIWRAPFQPVRITNVQLLPNGGFSFQEPGYMESYEEYLIDDVTEQKLSGTYTIYSRYGSAPGHGPKFSGKFYLLPLS